MIRIMPNTPASVGEGMIQYCSSNVTAEEEEAFRKIMAPAGRLDAVPENLIDAASCVSGCGPAWVYQFIEALADIPVPLRTPCAAPAAAPFRACACWKSTACGAR